MVSIFPILIQFFFPVFFSFQSNQRVRCWGGNWAQQLGDGSFANRGSGRGDLSLKSAVFVTFAPNINSQPIVAVEAGAYAAINIYIWNYIYRGFLSMH